MKILITGATGFIGNNIAEKLKENGHNIYILTRKKEIENDEYTIVLYNNNLTELIESFKRIKPDLVIHCAALFVAEHKSEDVDNLINSNILLTTHLLEAMRIIGLKNIINTSTSWQHYNNEDYNPVCLYAATKQAAEDIIKFYCNAEHFNCITLTIFDSYGPNDNRKKLFTSLKNAAENNEEINLSPGEQYLDYIYIEDIVNAYTDSIDLLTQNLVRGFKKYYLNSNDPLKLKEVIRIYQEIFNIKLKVNFGAREYRAREVMNTYRLGERLPNWYPKYSLIEGLKKIKDETRDKRDFK